MSDPRVAPNGDLVFPRRGPTPKDINGYKRDPDDPYHLIKEFLPCIYNQRSLHKSPCGKYTGEYNNCRLKGIIILPMICEQCEERI